MIKAASFDIYYHQLLTEEGILKGKLPNFAQDTQTLIELYQMMVQKEKMLKWVKMVLLKFLVIKLKC